MRGRAAIGVNDDLAPGDASIAVRPADLKAAGGVDVIFGLAQQDRGDDLRHHALDIGVEFGFTRALVIPCGVLGGDDHGGAAHRQAAFVTQGHLRFGVGFQKRSCARMAVGGHARQNLVAVIERRGHQIGGLVGGIAEHDALIAGAFILVAAGVHALRDMRGLAMQAVDEFKLFPVETVLFIADLADGFAHGGLDFRQGARRPFAVFIHALAADFTGQDHQLRGGQCLAGDARLGVFRQKQIDDRIRNLIRDLVGMTFGNALGSKQIIATHRSGSAI